MGRVTLEHVSKRYGDVVAVDDVNLDVEDGEFLTLVGPSGCGKSTTLETIAGLTRPTEGTITIAGRDVTDLPPKDRGIAMVFQNIALFPHMDVYDNISFGLRIRNYPTEEIERRVNRAADVVQLEGMLDRMPDELSGGQRQRVAISRAIVREPEVFLMDEPLANLDAKLRVHMRTELQRLHKELGTTVIYVTHDQAEAMTMSDRITVMNRGEIQQVAAPLTCYNEPANEFVAGFIGSPSMNFAPGVVTPGGVTTPHFEIGLDVEHVGLADGDEVTVGARPEDVYLVDVTDELSNPSNRIQARTDVLEPMGDEIFVYLVLDDERSADEFTEELEHARAGHRSAADVDAESDASDQLLMSVDPDTEIAEDEDVSVVLDRSKIHLFDAETGDAITHGVVEPRVPDRVERPGDADTDETIAEGMEDG